MKSGKWQSNKILDLMLQVRKLSISKITRNTLKVTITDFQNQLE